MDLMISIIFKGQIFEGGSTTVANDLKLLRAEEGLMSGVVALWRIAERWTGNLS
jgi:hypothetical protein